MVCVFSWMIIRKVLWAFFLIEWEFFKPRLRTGQVFGKFAFFLLHERWTQLLCPFGGEVCGKAETTHNLWQVRGVRKACLQCKSSILLVLTKNDDAILINSTPILYNHLDFSLLAACLASFRDPWTQEMCLKIRIFEDPPPRLALTNHTTLQPAKQPPPS